MIREVTTTSRLLIYDLCNGLERAKRLVLHNDLETSWALISIIGKGESQVIREIITKKIREVSPGYQRGLPLVFDDITEGRSGMTLFKESHAQKIMSFIDSVDDVAGRLVIHCSAGVSRSGAIGLFACDYLGLDKERFLTDNIVEPNRYISRVLTSTCLEAQL